MKNIFFFRSLFSHFSLKRILVLLTALFAFSNVWGADSYYKWISSTSGEWTTTSNWSGSQSGIGWDNPTNDTSLSTTAMYYVNTDDASGNITIVVSSDITVQNLVIESDSASSVTIVFENDATLTVTGTLTLGNRSSNNDTLNLTISGSGTIVAGTIQYNNKATDSVVTLASGITLQSDTFNNSSTGSLSVEGSGGLYLNGNSAASGITVASTISTDPPCDTTTYYWAGTDTGNWSDSANWQFKALSSDDYVSVSTYNSGAYDGYYPGYLDGDTAVLDPNEAVNNLTLNGTSYSLTIKNSSGSSSSRATIRGYVDSDNVKSSKITIDGYFLFDSVCVGSISTNANSKLQVTKYSAIGGRECSYADAGLYVVSAFNLDSTSQFYTSDGSGDTEQKPTLIASGKTTNDGEILLAGSIAKFYGDYTGTGRFQASTGKTFFYGNVDFSNASSFSANNGEISFITIQSKTLKTLAGQTFYTLRLGGNVTVDVSAGDISAFAVSLENDSEYFVSESFKTRINGGNKVTCNQGLFISRLSDTDGVTGTLELDCDAEVNNLFTMFSGSALIIDENRTLTVSGSQNDYSGTTYSNSITVNGTLDASSINLSFGYTTLYVGENGSIKTSSFSFLNNPLSSTYKAAGSVTYAISNNGTIDCSSIVMGTSASSLVKVDGSGTFVVSSGTSTLENLSIGSDIKIEKTSGTLVNGDFDVTDGSPSSGESQSDYAAVFKNGWNLGYEFAYTWIGGSSSDYHGWSTGDNWDIGISPGISSNNTTDVAVIIPDGCTYYPVVYRSDLRIKTLTIGTSTNTTHDALLTINNTAGIRLTNIDSALSTFINFSTVDYKSSGRLNDGTNPLNDAENGGTVKYSGTGLTITNFTDTAGESDYANLEISGSGTSSTENISIKGNLSVTGTGSLTAASGTFLFNGNQEQKIITSDSDNSTSTEFFTIEIDASSSVVTSSSFTVTGDFINNASSAGFTATGGAVYFTDNSSIYGDNTFWSFECTTAGKTLKFEEGKTQKINSSFKIAGSASAKVQLTSNSSSPSVDDTDTWWILNAPLSSIDVTYAEISYSSSVIDITSRIAEASNYNTEPSSAVFTTSNWFERVYYWLGSVSSSWADEGNWFFDIAGTYSASVPNDGSSSGATQKIVIATTGEDLVLEKDVSVQSITINDYKTLDFGKFSVTADDSNSSTSDFITGDNSILRFKADSSSVSSNSISGSTNFGTDTVFEYYGGGKVSAVSGDSSSSIPEIQVLKITNASDGTKTHLLLCSQNITIASGDAGFNEGIIEINGTGELSFSDSTLSMTSGLVMYTGGNHSVPAATFYDFAAFGSAYDTQDKDWHNSSNTRFAYPSSEYSFDFSSAPSASFSYFSGTISVANNFYINGADLSGVTLSLPAKTSSPVLNTSNSSSATMWGKPFAVALNMTATNCSSNVAVTAASPTTDFIHQNVVDGGGNTNWTFDSIEIVSAKSVADNVIYVELNHELKKIRQSGTITNRTHLAYNDGQNRFNQFYLNEACTTAISFTSSQKGFYIKSSDSWNSDADGLTTGTADSTNYSGTHKEVKLDLSLIEGFFCLKDGFTLSSEYSYDSANSKVYTLLEDNASPVLIAVYTGQEAHVRPDGTASVSDYSAETQKTYDSHNFIEFRYSEPVSLGDLAFDETDEQNLYNIEAQTLFNSSSVHGGAIVNQTSGGFTVTGFGNFSNGKVVAGYKSGTSPNFTGTTDTARPHALYRKFSLTSGGTEQEYLCRVRLSVAGRIEGTVSMPESFYNWIGYIDSAVCPTGTFKCTANQYITDKNGTSFNHLKNTSITVKSTAGITNELYGSWDVLPPVFATYVTNTDGSDADLCWTTGDGEYRQYEITGAVESNSSSYIDRIEIHLFDNKPNYTASDTYKWITQKGWMNGSTASFSIPESEGGSRPFDSSPKTKGGIRRSSLDGAYENFSYTYKLDSTTSESRSFGVNPVSQNVKSSIFREESATETVTENDGPYIALSLNSSDSTLPLRTSFVVTFTKENAFITDLAGNRLTQTDSNGLTKRLGGLDITPPSFSMVVSPIGSDKLYAIFTKPLAYNGEYLKGSLDSTLAENIKNNVEFVNSSGGIDTTSIVSDLNVVSVELASNSNAYTALLFTLNRKITLSDVESIWIRINENGENITNQYGASAVNSYIQDYSGNGVPVHTCHAVSDFAVNAVSVIYAYASEKDSDNWTDQNLLASSGVDGYTVHDFSADGGNYQRLLAEHDVTFQFKFTDYDNASDDFVIPSYGLSFVYDKKSSLKSSWISDRFNNLTGLNWRLWTDKPMTSLASGFNDSIEQEELTLDSSSLLQTIQFVSDTSLLDASNNIFEYKFSSNESYDFFFKIKDVEIDHDGDVQTVKIPLYCFWTPSENITRNDFSFVDLWSFKISSVSQQRGGVSILNNVINPASGEKTVIEVEMPSDGNLNIFVMSLDGNIIKRLSKGKVNSGTHYFYWDGKNNAGKAVARGLYFVRVSGNGIDETRKVMVVK